MALETKWGTIAQFVYLTGLLILYFMNMQQMSDYFNICKTQVLPVVLPIYTFIIPVHSLRLTEENHMIYWLKISESQYSRDSWNIK